MTSWADPKSCTPRVLVCVILRPGRTIHQSKPLSNGEA